MTEPEQNERRPWPMTWVVVAIVAFITLYTMINVVFRKEEAPHKPYEEAQERQSRYFDFDMNGWKWLEAVPTTAAPRAEEIQALTISSREVTGRLDQDMPMDLVTAIPKRPDLVGSIESIEATRAMDRSIKITLIRAPDDASPVKLEAFLKDGQVVILAVEDKEESAENQFSLELTEDLFTPGDYSVSLYSDPTVYEWTFTLE